MSKKLARVTFILVGALAFAFLSLAVKYAIFWDLQKRLDLKVQGDLKPSVLESRFQIHQASFVWKEKLKFLSGDLDLRYDLAYFLRYRKWHIQIKSKNAVIYLLGDWAKIQGRDEVPLTELNADLIFDQQKILDINYIEAYSPTFHFSIK